MCVKLFYLHVVSFNNMALLKLLQNAMESPFINIVFTTIFLTLVTKK